MHLKLGYPVDMDEIELNLHGLSDRMLMFVYEYLKDFNGTRAAIAAGYSEKSAHVEAHGLIRHPKLKKYLIKARKDRIEAVRIDAHWVLEQLKAQYEFNLDDFTFLNDRGEPYYDFSEATPEQMHCIESLEVSPGQYGTKIKVKTMSKKDALGLIGKHVDVEAFKEKVEHVGDVHFTFDRDDELA